MNVLTQGQRAALLEIARPQFEKSPYWWRKQSMLALEEYGLVMRAGGTQASPGWRITEKGRMVAQALKGKHA